MSHLPSLSHHTFSALSNKSFLAFVVFKIVSYYPLGWFRGGEIYSKIYSKTYFKTYPLYFWSLV